MTPGLAAGASETMLITVSNCAAQPATRTITVTDSLGHTFTFDMNLPSNK